MKIEVSIGELVDKITILEIKLKNVTDAEKIKNVKTELDILKKGLENIPINDTHKLYVDLKEINQALWDIEDKIRIKEKNKEFDQEFIELARSVYFTNDKRAMLKRAIDVESGSLIINEKQYEDYQ
ncbi:MAG: DUF6165 family protein [Melioribacteraceae bacterium]|nr:DUF6165 family protein [Melioribacteraceae bacterium]MCF8265506.1 DUF6165 family protein [Melioribacteraceae bacterium]MCF8413915.1 DUF6165 family protein [Melioribacteraceae bacterium]MCF8432546.1 DUF6165 family protein [Melioribacteraceae bacterium]